MSTLNTTTSNWQPYREPLRTTLLRTGTIAVVIGALLTRSSGGISRWPMATLLALWPAFGGHWIELCFLNYVRPRLTSARAVQLAARVVIWFIGGAALTLGMHITAMALSQAPAARWPPWWLGGLAFIAIELFVHLVL